MISVEEALRLIHAHLPQGLEAQDRTLEDLISDRDYPPFHRVMMGAGWGG